MTATPQTTRAAAQVLRMAKTLDDRMGQPDKARIAAWADQVQRHKLTEPDLMDGLQAYYDGPSTHAIGIGDLIAHAKTARTNRIAKENRAEREARQTQLDATKPAPDDTQAIATAFVAGPVEKTDRLTAAEDALQTCVDKASAQAAIREFFAAKLDARKRGTADLRPRPFGGVPARDGRRP